MEKPEIKFDISKIKGPYQLLGAFLIIVEVFIGFWFSRAENATERIIAGVLMTLIFLAFLYVIIYTEREERKPIVPPGLGSVTPAQEEATEKEIESPEPERIGAPDGSYSINKPPNDWTIQELSLTEWMSQAAGITDPSVKEKIFGKSSQVHEILSLKSKRETFVTPIPGKTIFDGRKLPTALSLTISTRLAIIPMDRVQPPFFIDRPFEHNFLEAVCPIMQPGVVTLRSLLSGTIPNSQLRYKEADFRQEIVDAIVDDKAGKSLNSNIIIIGIEGDFRDYLLFMNYPSMINSDNPELERDLKTLQSLASSFRPLKTINPEEKQMQIKQRGDQNFKDLIKNKGEDMFFAEFSVVLLRLSGLKLDDLEQRTKAIKMLKPFETLAKEINLQDEDLNKLWSSLQEAEKGNATEFKLQFNKFLEAMKGEQKNVKAIPPPKSE